MQRQRTLRRRLVGSAVKVMVAMAWSDGRSNVFAMSGLVEVRQRRRQWLDRLKGGQCIGHGDCWASREVEGCHGYNCWFGWKADIVVTAMAATV